MKKNNTKLVQACAIALFGFSAVSAHAANSVGLTDIYQMAVNHDAQLAQQRAEFEASKESVKSVKATLLPEITADGSYFMNKSDSATGDVNTRDLSITLNQPLYNKAIWSRFEQAKYVTDQAKSSLQNAEQDLILRVANAYFKVLLAQEDVRLSNAQEQADKLQWDRAQASAEVGLGSRSDVLQAKSSYDLTKSQRISNQNNLDVAFEELMKLTGKPVMALDTLQADANLPSETFDMEEWAKLSEDNNLLVKQVEAQFKTATEEVAAQKAGHWPVVGLQARISDTQYSNNSAFRTDSTGNSIGVSVSVPLYSGGGTTAKVSEARFNQTSAQQALRDSREQARLNARIQVRSVERGESLVAALREAVKSNSSFLEAAEEGYKVGLKNLLEVLTARSNLYNAQRNLMEAMHNQVLNRLNLEATVGDLTAEDLMRYDALMTASK